jgi:hypothetical protein
MAAAHDTRVRVNADRGLTIACDAGDYSADVPLAVIRGVFGPDMVGEAVLRVVYHVEHVENGTPAELLR